MDVSRQPHARPVFSLFLLCVFLSWLRINAYDMSKLEKGDWNDFDLVLINGQWYRVPMDEIYEHPLQGHPPKPYDQSHLSNDTSIVVLIASFRETRCKDTLFNFFTKALNPRRVFISVVQQNQKGDPDCMIEYCRKINPNSFDDSSESSIIKTCPYASNIRMLRIKASEAKGPVYARALGNTLVKHTDQYCLQIDAHTDVAKNWDFRLLKEWSKADNEYAILSTYPSNIKDIGKNSNNHWEMPHLCEAHVVGNGAVRNARARAAANLRRPIIAPLWAAGLSFSKCHAELRVPNDIHLKHVFNGEEFSRGSRLWTHGYDFYTPTRAWLGTFYQAEKGGLGNWRSNHTELKQSNDRMSTLLGFPHSDQSLKAHKKLGFYDLGNKRTMQQYIEFTGVDPMKKKSDWQDKCVASWIPWDDSEERRQFDEKGHILPKEVTLRLGISDDNNNNGRKVNSNSVRNSPADTMKNMLQKAHLLSGDMDKVNQNGQAKYIRATANSDRLELSLTVVCVVCSALVIIAMIIYRRDRLNRWFREKSKRDSHIV